MAQLLLQGTNFINFVGYNAWVGGEGDDQAVNVTEWDEPQAVIGSYLHRYAYPDWFAAHEKRPRTARTRTAMTPARSAACSCEANICTLPKAAAACSVYDVASQANKGVSQRSSRRRSARWATTLRWLEECDLRCAADQPADSSAAQHGREDARDEPGAADSIRCTTTRTSPTRRKG